MSERLNKWSVREFALNPTFESDPRPMPHSEATVRTDPPGFPPWPSLASRQHAASLHSHPARTYTLALCFWTYTSNLSPSAGQPTLPPSSMAAYTDRPHLSEAHTKSQLYHPSHLGEALAELAIKSYVPPLLILWCMCGGRELATVLLSVTSTLRAHVLLSSCAFLAPIWLTTTSIACFLSRFETCARSDTFTPATHASLNQILYSTLLQASPSALPSSSHSLPRTASPNWPTFKLSDVQRDARKLDVKGKGKERYVGEAGTAGEKGQVGVGDLDKMGWRKDRCERAFERGDLVYRIKCVSPLLLF